MISPFRLLLLPFLLLLAACGAEDAAKNAAPPAPVHVAEAVREDISRDLQVIGNVRSSASVGLVPRVAGEILEVNFTEGQDVKAGQPLIRIDPRPYETALKEKQAVLARSEAQLVKARHDRDRYGKLAGSGFVSKEAFEQTATDAATLRATVQADRAAVESAALDLSYCTLKAPISGRIGSLQVHRGNMVKSNDSAPIASIDTISPCYVTFSVPETHLAAIMERMRQGHVELTATPSGGRPATGLLTLVDNNVDEKTGTIRLRGTFENSDRGLWPGQFVQVRLPLGIARNVLVVPSRAIQAGRDESYVYVAGEDGRAAFHKVKVLFENEGKSVVEGDLQPGQKVVVEGQVRLAPGIPIKILN